MAGSSVGGELLLRPLELELELRHIDALGLGDEDAPAQELGLLHQLSRSSSFARKTSSTAPSQSPSKPGSPSIQRSLLTAAHAATPIPPPNEPADS